MVALLLLQVIVAVPVVAFTVMTGSGSVSFTSWVVTDDAFPLRTVMALIVTGEFVLPEMSKAPLYTVPVVAVGFVPSIV